MVVCKLPVEQFPAGNAYFSGPSSGDALAVVVHNNFIIGHDNKKERFIRANLWHPHGTTTRRHPETAPVSISADAKLVTSHVGSSLLVWLKEHELVAHAQVSAPGAPPPLLPLPQPPREPNSHLSPP